MPKRRIVLHVAGAILISLLGIRTAGAQLSAGAAKVDITPEVGVSLDGPISKGGPVTSVHDPLHARALVLSDGRIRIAIVIVDNCVTARDVLDRAKRGIESDVGIPVGHVLAAATHTHAAPRTVHISREPIDQAYHERVSAGIREAVCRADANLAPARIAHASFDCGQWIACRRFLCEPGSVGANPFGFRGERIKSVAGSSSKVIGPAGPVDPEFSILSVRHDDGSPLCVLGNFSVHYCGGYRRGVVSADYFGSFAKSIESALGGSKPYPPVVGIMSNGTSGNTGSFQRTAGTKWEPFERMQHFGRLLGEAALSVLSDLPHQSDLSLAVANDELTLAVRRPDRDRLDWASSVLSDNAEKPPHRWSSIYAREAQHLADFPPQVTIPLQAFRIGEIAIAAAPCEVFAETGLAIKRASPFEQTFTIELANDYAGYLPPREQHELGGYETWPARSSFLEIDAEQAIRESLVRLLHELGRSP
jgi:hypothetical protein